MKNALRESLLTAIAPYLSQNDFENIKMRFDMILNDYDISKNETAITVYEGDLNNQMLSRFLVAKVARGCTPRTVNFYKNSLNLIFARIGKPYNEITADDIRMYMAIRVQHDGVTKTTANNERRNLSAFYGWLQREEILLTNPMLKVENLKVEKTKKPAFTNMDIEKMRMACSTSKDLAMFEILLSTWARVSEVSQIRLCEITGNKILVHGKGEKDRDVYLNAKAVLAIENYLADRSDNNPYLFPRAKYAGDVVAMTKGIGRRLSSEWYKKKEYVDETLPMDKGTIESRIRAIGKKAGVSGAHPHRFRRTGATNALRNGMPLIQVSKILGHANIGTTQIYLDISDKELEQAHEKYVL